MNKKIKARDNRIDVLEYALEDTNEIIDKLENKVSKLLKTLDYFKKLWQKIIEFLQYKFF